MDYVFLIYAAEKSFASFSKEEGEKMMHSYGTYTKDLFATGKAGDCAALERTGTATSVRVRDGKRTVTDGPFAETREQLGGYYALTTDDPEEAIGWAAKMPGASIGRIEVRPLGAMPSAGDAAPKTVSEKDGFKEYIFLIYDDEAVWAKMTPAQRDAMLGRYMQFTADLKQAGQFVAGAPLQHVKTAKTVRVEGQKRVVADGPFAETREQLGGYYRAWAKNLDEAITIATKIPSVEVGTIEVRPVLDTSAYV
ncbi:YciI family protein [soil metagenome]